MLKQLTEGVSGLASRRLEVAAMAWLYHAGLRDFARRFGHSEADVEAGRRQA